ncbi:hypothetical protein [Nocardia rosealba]|uniref:hypothetical protein n=1 Tax=Nocardia rosealba TaxID=2878563 RepID=UPI001CDA21AC|nr:hypothetical protein [Nocardia rosealba]MCA2209351.1 hypothetical protein [Nocardia rosealba]
MEQSERRRPPLPMVWKIPMAVATVATLASCAWLLWACCRVFDDDEVRFWAGAAAVVPIMVWLVSTIISAIRYSGWWRWSLVLPLCVIITVLLTEFYVPGRIGWQMSRGDMERAAAECERLGAQYRNATSGDPAALIGQYEFHRIEDGPDGECEFHFPKGYQGVGNGFVYIPSGRNPDGIGSGDTNYVHLGGHWYYYK